MSLKKFPLLAAVVCALVLAPAALAASLTIKTTPTRVKLGHSVEMLISGLKPGEKVKGKEVAPFGQTRTIYPSRRANGAGQILVTVKAQIKGKHTWTFTGRTSHRKGTTVYYVK
jgi:hypothetical protein